MANLGRMNLREIQKCCCDRMCILAAELISMSRYIPHPQDHYVLHADIGWQCDDLSWYFQFSIVTIAQGSKIQWWFMVDWAAVPDCCLFPIWGKNPVGWQSMKEMICPHTGICHARSCLCIKVWCFSLLSLQVDGLIGWSFYKLSIMSNCAPLLEIFTFRRSVPYLFMNSLLLMSWMLGFGFSLAFSYPDLLFYLGINYFELDVKFKSYPVF